MDDDFLAEGAKLAESTRVFGKLLTSMTREELIAVAAHGWAAYSRSLQRSASDMRLLCDLHKASRQ